MRELTTKVPAFLPQEKAVTFEVVRSSDVVTLCDVYTKLNCCTGIIAKPSFRVEL